MKKSISSQNLKAAARAGYKNYILELKFSRAPPKHKLNKSLGEVFKPDHVFSGITFQHFLLTLRGTKP